MAATASCQASVKRARPTPWGRGSLPSLVGGPAAWPTMECVALLWSRILL